MSSIELYRNAELNNIQKQLLTVEVKRKGLIEELCRITYALNNPTVALHYNFDAPAVDEVRVLDENDLGKGRYFSESTVPVLVQNVKTSSQPAKQPARSPSPIRNNKSKSSEAAVDTTKASASVDPAVAASQSLPSPTASDPQATDEAEMARLAKKRQPAPKLDSVNIKETHQPPTPIDLALATDKSLHQTSDTHVNPDRNVAEYQKTLRKTEEDPCTPSISNISASQSRKTPKVVHLPPREVRAGQAKEVEHAQDVIKKREKKEDERLSVPLVAPITAEAASSPSSTVGAHSTFTPRPTHTSPDTSPDTDMSIDGAENLDVETEINPSAISSGQEQQTRSDRVSKKGLDTTAESPDTQLKQEEEQAIKNSRDRLGNVSSRTAAPPVNAKGKVKERKAIDTEAQAQSPQPVMNGAPSLHTSLPDGVTSKDGGVRRNDSRVIASVKAPGGVVESMDISPIQSHADAAVDSGDIDMLDVPHSKDNLQSTNHSGSHLNARSELQMPTTPTSSTLQPSIYDQATSPVLDPLTLASTSSRSRKRKFSQSSPRNPIDQSRLSGVVFSKPLSATLDPSPLLNPDYAALAGVAEEGQRDYLVPLFTYQAHLDQQQRGRPQVQEERKFKGQGHPLQALIQVANKTCNTSNFHVTIRESQENRILKRIYHLQNANRWALRQMERCEEPRPEEAFLDHLLLQMKAMRTDFREERKLKQAIAADLAYSCAEWHAASPEERIALQVKTRRSPQQLSADASEKQLSQLQELDSQASDNTHRTPELIPSGATETDIESVQDDDLPFLQLSFAEPAAALFTKDSSVTILDVAGTPSTNDLFAELPLYEPTLVEPLSTKEDIPAVSKYVASKIVSTATGPPRKRSRYDYEPEERTDDPDYPNKRPSTGTSTSGHATPMTPGFLPRKGGLDPEMTNVALFAPSNRHLLKRLHDTHAFRPPSEFAMPTTSFLAARLPSQWTWEEDQKLRQLVKDYSYNWSLISDELKTKSILESQADRRTPWECFERWAGLEGLPQEMHKTSYFKTWFSRLDAASALVEKFQRQQMAQAGAINPNIPLHQNINGIQGRKRHRVPIRIEKKHNSRYIYIMNGIVRRMRKAEAAAHKQQENAKAAQMRKNQAHNDAGMAGTKQAKLAATPQELSRLRAERDAKLKEKAEQYRQQLELQRQAMHNGQRPTHPATAVAAQQQQQQRNSMQQSASQAQSALSNPSSNSANHSQMAQPSAANPQVRQSQMAALQQAMQQGIQQPGAQANMAGQMRGGANSPESLRIAMGHRSMQANGQQNFQQIPHGLTQTSLAAAHMAPANPNNMQNQALLAALAGNINGTNTNARPGSAASPRVNQQNVPIGNAQLNMHAHAQNAMGQPQPLSSGVVPMVAQIQHQISSQNPQLTLEQVRLMTNARLKDHATIQRQQAMLAAAGNSGISNMNANMMPSPSMASAYNIHQQGGSQSPPQQSGMYHASQVQRMNQLMQQQQQRNQAQSPAMMQRMPHAGGSPVNIGASPAMSQARPVSRSATPMQRQGSGSGMGMGSPMMGQAGMR